MSRSSCSRSVTTKKLNQINTTTGNAPKKCQKNPNGTKATQSMKSLKQRVDSFQQDKLSDFELLLLEMINELIDRLKDENMDD
mgnify:FL=1